MNKLFLFIAIVLAGCASAPPQSPALQRVAIDSYAVRAELALAAEQPAEAARLLLDAALLSSNVQYAERATRLADELGLSEVGLRAVGRWRELAPDDDRPTWFFGVFQTRTAQYDDAIRSFRTLIERLEPQTQGAGLALVLESLIAEPIPAAGTLIMRALTDAFPGHPEGYYALARLAFRSGDFELALENAAAATDALPDWTEARLLYARTLLVAGHTEQSLTLARQLVDDIDSAEIRLQYAELLLSAGRSDEAEAILTELRRTNPGMVEATRALAFLALAADELDRAEQYFEEMRAEPSYRDETFYYLGRIAESKGEQLQATRSYTRVTQGSHAVEAQLRTARIMFDQTGDPEAALQHLAEFGGANPRFATDMLVARGQILVQVGRSDDAIALIDGALAAAPSDAALQNASVQLYIGLAQDASGRRALGEAERLLTDGLKRHPGNVSIRYSQALLYEDQGRLRRAADVLEELAEQQPDNPAVLNAYGYLLTDELNRHEEAEGFIRRALAMDPDNAAIIDSMGWVLFKLGDLDGALDYLERAARLVSDPEMAAHLIDVHWALGDVARARELLESSLAEFPDSDHLIEVGQRIGQ